jgi:hypothetical protein
VVIPGNGSGEIRSEGRDPAAPRPVCADECYGHRAIGGFRGRDTRRTVDTLARVGARALVVNNGGNECH